MRNSTKTAIKEAFMTLLNKKPFDKITVKEIVEECGINRNTFYYHYEDIYDLLHPFFLIIHLFFEQLLYFLIAQYPSVKIYNLHVCILLYSYY